MGGIDIVLGKPFANLAGGEADKLFLKPANSSATSGN
jgi:hypothetical protein